MFQPNSYPMSPGCAEATLLTSASFPALLLLAAWGAEATLECRGNPTTKETCPSHLATREIRHHFPVAFHIKVFPDTIEKLLLEISPRAEGECKSVLDILAVFVLAVREGSDPRCDLA